MAAGASLDWSLVQAFLAVAESGSLSAASRTLGVAQPTIGRQVRALEEQLGIELFHRHDKGLTLTDGGQTLLGSARSMRLAASEMELRAAGHGKNLGGAVRIATSVAVATHHLPAIASKLRVEYPQIGLDIVPDDESSNLLFREADIAVRMYRPTQLELVAQHLGDFHLGAFAGRKYVERRGLPQCVEEILEHEVVGFDRQTVMIEAFRRGGLPIERDWFKVRVDDQAVYWQLVRAGCGIGFAQCTVGRTDPEVAEVPVDFGLPVLPVWLTAHEAVRRTPRVDLIWGKLALAFKAILESDANRRPGAIA
jgi:DNA-binding transcriptional LysR family regulator